MTKIYEKAAKVYVWLGAPTEETELAMAISKAMEAVPADAHYGNNPKCQFVDLGESWKRDLFPVDVAMAGGLPSQPVSTFSEPWEAVIKVFCNPYWTRVKILQEITCPAEQELRSSLGVSSGLSLYEGLS